MTRSRAFTRGSCLLHVLLTLTLGWSSPASVNSAWTAGRTYQRCPERRILSGPTAYDIQTFPSLYACVTHCSGDPQCQAINVFHDGRLGDRVDAVCYFFPTCLHADCGNVDCDALSVTMFGNSFHLVKLPEEAGSDTTTAMPETTASPIAEETSEEPLICQNGGVLVAGVCDCPYVWAGEECERYPMDCNEVGQYSLIAPVDGTYYIQPYHSSAPFLVVCRFYNDVGLTHTFEWYTGCGLGLDTMSYTDIKAGKRMAVNCYFVGLQNLHDLLKQSLYQLQVYAEHNHPTVTADAYYYNFTLDSEQYGYALDYDSFTSGGLLNAWPVNPAPFSYDIDYCALAQDSAGWMGPDCETDAVLFQSVDAVKWPVDGQGPTPINLIAFVLQRLGSLPGQG